MHKNLRKELFIRLDMQHLYQLGCDWTDTGNMFLHQGANVLTDSIDSAMNVIHLRTISNIKAPVHCIATMPAIKTGKFTTNTLYIFEVDINEVVFRTPS